LNNIIIQINQSTRKLESINAVEQINPINKKSTDSALKAGGKAKAANNGSSKRFIFFYFLYLKISLYSLQ